MESVSHRSQLIEVQLEDGTRIKVSATTLGGSQNVSDKSSIFSFDEIANTIGSIAKSISGVLQQVKPDKATIEFGIEVGVESGKLTALLVKGTTTANLKVSLEWNHSS